MKNSTKIFAACVGFFGFAGSAAAQAQAPAAVVEDVRGKVIGAEFMDYVIPGRLIRLGPGATIVLGYMKSCRRELISGTGTVVVGEEESTIHDAEIKASKVRCESGYPRTVDQEVAEGAATSFRSIEVTPASPQLMLYGRSPFLETSGHGKLVVERLDAKGERYEIDLAATPLVRGKFYDFAKSGISLNPGGTYTASLGSHQTVFAIDRRAEPGATPIIGRLVRLQ